MIRRLLAWAIICLHVANLSAIFPDNIFEIDYTKTTPRIHPKRNWQFGVTAEGMFNTKAHNESGDRVNVLQIWQPNQNSLTMLRGFNAESQIGKLASNLNVATDNGVRGHEVPTANLTGGMVNFTFKHRLPCNLTFNAALPLFSFRLKNVEWIDLTQSLTFADQLVKAKLTNNLASIVADLGDGLDILSGWEKTGVGDLQLTVDWYKTFKQHKPILKTVSLGLNAGFSLPSGVRQNEDLIMSIPFGNDGAFAFLFGGQIRVQWWQHLRGGITANFLEILGTTRARRIKTDPDQSDLLLLAKAQTRKGWGFTQQFLLHLEAVELADYFALRTTYSYMKHNQDRLSILDESYSGEIANTALSLQEWTQHYIMLSLKYEGPLYAEIFYKYPFNGKNTLQSELFGCSLAWNF